MIALLPKINETYKENMFSVEDIEKIYKKHEIIYNLKKLFRILCFLNNKR